MRLLVLLIIISFQSSAENKYQFDIPPQAADKALILFAKQANSTLLFPVELAEHEVTNGLNGNYTVELGLVKLLEGTGLYPIKDEKGLSVKAIIQFERIGLMNLAATKTTQNVFSSIEMEKIAVVGTRSAPRSIIDSPVPLDIIGVAEFIQQGDTDIISMLATLVPSFNVNDQPINDASSLVRPANLRGMASDHTLILVNGKRRHRSSAITFLGGGLSDGAQGVDISNIPASSLQQIEVLRDGAAAQYGSDAIAGVINFVLNDNDEGGMVDVRLGQFSEGDGELLQIQGNLGLPLGSNGFINISTEFKQQGATDRSVQRDDALALSEAGNEYVANPAQVWGSPEVNYNIKSLINMGYQLNTSNQIYSFSNLAQRKIQGGFYFRNPHTRDGLFEGTTDKNSAPTLLVADLDGTGQGISCPEIPITDNNVLDDSNFLLIADKSTALGQNCFSFNEILPGGFTPLFGGTISDASWVLGIKGQTSSAWDYDLSVGVGYSEIDYQISRTVNPSLGPNTPFSFNPGLASQLEKNVNLDLFKQFNIDEKYTINFATGLEWRKESYRQKEGDLASYALGDLAFDPNTGLSQGFGVGSNGFPGYNPQSSGEWSRGNWAFYTDFEVHMSDAFLFGLAARYEDFSDFGATFDGKLSARMILNESLTLRGSMSTGFKAPTVGQSNVVNVTTAFSANGLEDQATLPPTNAISIQLGATPLRPEESLNTSFGIVGKIAKRFYFTLDYFYIQLFDRISTTSALTLSQEDIQTLVAAGITEATSYGSAKYFTNDFDSTTQGLDLVINYETYIFNTQSRFMFNYNWTDTVVDRVTLYNRVDSDGSTYVESNLTQQRIKMIENNLPAQRASLSLKQSFKKLTNNFRLNFYDGFYEDHLDAAAGLDIVAGSEITLDVDISYQYKANFTLSIGAKNLFDNRPDNNPFSGEAGALYPATSPIGINGGFYYLRGMYEF
ncbi:TonB-dependent siderophore receptor [Paraglaciecola sp. MB-3u-78]|uniref:TonB-dependent receptor plug domain-containing protein n=1 Tax=Paraglaciecola sp. MB-3u-78 TaxID=2058332 RepID=UPI000C340A23|nr:TonB-dependent receptor [Paraglaciecola sp. MB-3u-78]PKG99640.1 TonB-dependent receptor [Paraglaciecola sp. MB-3u-78]